VNKGCLRNSFERHPSIDVFYRENKASASGLDPEDEADT
jgi:hypothetical protein